MFKYLLFVISCFIIFPCFCQSGVNKPNALTDTVPTFYNKTENIGTSEKPSLKIYPNPAKNKVSLIVNGFDAGMAIVKITDLKGKVCRADTRMLSHGMDEITMFLQLQPGIYFISINEKSKIVKKKIIVQ